MEKQPLVSIAVCVYNGAKYLSKQLDSIFNQDYNNIEVIVVDDCSTDMSKLVLEQYADQYPSLKLYCNHENLGYVKNFERAISLCNGRYIALSDHDDIWSPSKISMQVKAIPGYVMVYHDSQYIDENDNEMDIKMSDLLRLQDWTSPIPFFLKNSVSGHTILFDRILLEHALPFNPRLFHDWWLAFVAVNLGPIKYLPITLVKYRQHLNNTIDMLNLRQDKLDEVPPNPLLLSKEWIQHCSNYKGNYANYLKKISCLIKKEISFLEKLRLFFLLIKYKDEFMATSKEPIRRNLKKIRSMVFNLNKK